MRPSWLMSLMAAGICVSGSVNANAQPLFGHAESIESMVANSDHVVVGTLANVGLRKNADAGTISVHETLKGQHRDRLEVRLAHPASVLTQWKEKSSRLLVAAREETSIVASAIDLANRDLTVLTADFTLLRKPDDVLRIAKEVVRRMPGIKSIDTFGLAVPREAIAGTSWESYYRTGGHLVLKVPVDERLEKVAHASIRSKDYRQRQEGVRALRFFRSNKNAAQATALLADPEWSRLYRAEDNMGLEVRIYGVRQAAYETLQYWGIKAEKPLIREEIQHEPSVEAKPGTTDSHPSAAAPNRSL
jgi:hypothetical protein